MSYPKIALIGRPNVGKSALFNRLLKKRIAIVDEMEGVTRDRLYAESEFEANPFILIDTAGIETSDHSELNQEILQQSQQAIEEANFCIFVVDAQIGITKMDQQIAKLLRKKGKPVVLAVNKIDIDAHEDLISPFYTLGFEDMWGVSAEHGRHIYELLESVFKRLPEISDLEGSYSKKEKVSIVGRTNVGKSTLMNTLSKQDRCVVSPIAGTTRDAIEVEIEYDGQKYNFIDTAGIRRKNKEVEVVEKFAHIRTINAIEDSEVCIFMIDAQDGLTAQEKKLLSQIYEMGKSCVVLVNKWDLAKGFRMEHAYQALLKDSPFIAIYPTLFISAKTGRNIDKIFSTVSELQKARKKVIETSKLNKFIEEAIQKSPPPMILGKRLRIYYMTQIKGSPPTFIFFVNSASLLTPTYKRYLLNRMRESFDLKGAPVQFFLRGKDKAKKDKKVKESSFS